MLAKHDVAVRMLALLLPALLYAAPVMSQSQRSSNSQQRAEQSKVPRAPVGHRQPTAADVPKDLPTTAEQAEHERRERELDAKLQICRGC